MKKLGYRVVKVYNENELEDTLNQYVEDGYEVHQIFLRSFFVPSNKQRGLYYAIIFKLIEDESQSIS